MKNKTNLRSIAVAALSLSVGIPWLLASNPPYGSECETSTETCSTCEEEKSGDVETCPGSFNYSVNLGYTPIKRVGDFLNYSRLGLSDGQAGRGYYRNFDQVRADFFDPSNVTNRQMDRLVIIQPAITAALYSPAVLGYNQASSTEFIKSGGVLRQVLTDSNFTQIDALADGFTITVWNRGDLANLNKTGGLYTAPGSSKIPLSVSTFKNPNHPSAEGRLLLTVKENFSGAAAREITTLYDQNDPDSEIIRSYAGPDTTGDIIEETTMVYSNRGSRPWDYTLTKTSKVAANAGGGLVGALKTVSVTREVYQDFSASTAGGDQNGKRLMSLTRGYGAPDPVTTTYDFYSAPTNLFLNGRLKSQVNPDGSWEYWEYSDQPGSTLVTETRYSSWKDVPLASYQQGMRQHTEIAKGNVTRTVTINGNQVSKATITSTTDSITGNITHTQKNWDGSHWSETTTVFGSSASGTLSAGRPLSQTLPDGTGVIHAYSLLGGDLKVTTSIGELDGDAIVAGTATIVVYNGQNNVVHTETMDIESGLQTSFKTGSNFDALGRAQMWIYNGDTDDFETMTYGCCGVESTRDRTGATTVYSRDILKRVYKVTRKSSSTDTPVETVTSYDGLTTTTIRSDGTNQLFVSESTRSLNGLSNVSKSPDADTDSSGGPEGNPETTTRITVYNSTTGSTETTTHPDLTTTVTQNYLDGSMKSSTDQLGNVTSFDKNTHTESGGGIVTRTTQPNGTEWTETYADQLGRTFKTKLADGAESLVAYYPFDAAPGSRGKTASSTDPDGVAVSYSYDAEGDLITTTEPMPDSQQRVTVTDRDVVNDTDIGTSERTRTSVNGILVATSLSQTIGYASKYVTLSGTYTSLRSVPTDGAWIVTSTAADGVQSRSFYTDALLQVTLVFEDGAALPTTAPADITSVTSIGFIGGSSATYDSFDRTLTTTDSRTGTSTMGSYLESGSLLSVTDPGGRTTSFTYDVMGRTTSTTLPDATVTKTSYTLRGETEASWGSQTYPTFRVCDEQGRLVTLRTKPTLDGSGKPTNAGGSVTTWIYDTQRGWLNGKRDDANKGADYTYTPAGRLATRTWGRSSVAQPKVTTYTYDAGMLTFTDYSDTTPDVLQTYDSFGRPLVVKNGTSALVSGAPTIATPLSSTTYAYDSATLVLDTETIAYDIDLSGTPELTRTLDRKQDSLLRPSGWQLIGTSTEHQAGYGYDSAGRLNRVDPAYPLSGSPGFTYGYEPDSYRLVKTVSGPAHTVTNTWEGTRNALAQKNNEGGGTTVSQYDYRVNGIGQRTSLASVGTGFDGSSFALATATGPTYGWTYNASGELTEASDTSVANNDRAYEYDAIGNRKKSVDGLAAALPGTDNYESNSLNQYTAVDSFSPTYDIDGNQKDAQVLPLGSSSLASCVYGWDGENRLISVTVNSTTTTYHYDSSGRRIATNISGGTTLVIYDGWNPVAYYAGSLGSSPTLTKTNLWGMDLSDSMQGAGGVGGLLSVTDSTDTYYPTYDGNGNVSEYLDSTGAVKAHYEYDPCGSTTVATGSKAADFTHRFSTKPFDAETGLYYYGYRYYDPVTGRWPSRDPIGEEGGINLYAFVVNDGINGLDILGLAGDSKRNCNTFSAKVDFNLDSIPAMRAGPFITFRVSAGIRGELSIKVCDQCCDGKWIAEGYSNTNGNLSMYVKGSLTGGIDFDEKYSKFNVRVWAGIRGEIDGKASANVNRENECGEKGKAKFTSTVYSEGRIMIGGAAEFLIGDWRVGKTSATGGGRAWVSIPIEGECEQGSCSITAKWSERKQGANWFIEACAFGGCFRHDF